MEICKQGVNRVLILCSQGFNDYGLVSMEMERFIREKDMFLFDIVCGGQSDVHRTRSMGEIWAINNGAPRYYIFEPNGMKLLGKMVNAADYLMAFYDGKDAMIRRMIGMFKSAGKNGAVIRV